MFDSMLDRPNRCPLLTHYQGRIPDVTLGCIQYLRKQFPSVRVSVEAEKPGRLGLQELADAADMVFFSKSWAQVSSTSVMVKRLGDITDGSNRVMGIHRWRIVCRDRQPGYPSSCSVPENEKFMADICLNQNTVMLYLGCRWRWHVRRALRAYEGPCL